MILNQINNYMEIKDKVELPIMDDRIWKLFNILINTEPKCVCSNILVYNINDIDIKLIWEYEKEEDKFKPYTFVNPINEYCNDSNYVISAITCSYSPSLVTTGKIKFFIDTPYKKYCVRKLTFEEQYVYQKKLYGIYFNYDINYLNQFLPKSDLSGIDLDAPGDEQLLGYEQKIIEDSERVKKY